ncbi:MAG: hypothetical protein IKV86_03550 [Clostridia bacterium]|nr:hypothetical protein [Clostridia bacterium]
MKKIIGIILVLTVVLSMIVAPFAVYAESVWDGSVAKNFAGGKGTKEDPYVISEASQLAFLAQSINARVASKFNGKYYRLESDINLNNINWTPIAVDLDKAFNGVFDGNGHIIRNLNITLNDSQFASGLFGYIDNATISNLGIDTATVTPYGEYHGNSDKRQSLGVLVGVVKAKGKYNFISDCFVRNAKIDVNIVSDTVEDDDNSAIFGAGPLVGDANGIGYASNSYATVVNCYSLDIIITGNDGAGGRVGTKNSATGFIGGKPFGWTIKNCYAANVTVSKFGNYQRMFGSLSNGTHNPDMVIENCFYSKFVIGNKSEPDGVVELYDAILKEVPTELSEVFVQSITDGFPMLKWELPSEDVIVMRQALASIVIKNEKNPQKGIELCETAIAGDKTLNVIWTTSDDEVITTKGEVYPGTEGEKIVTLTASVTYNKKTESKDFVITVPKVMPYEIDGVEINNNLQNRLEPGKEIRGVYLTRFGKTGTGAVLVSLYKDGVLTDCVVENLNDASVSLSGSGEITLSKVLKLPQEIKNVYIKISVFGQEGLTPCANSVIIR